MIAIRHGAKTQMRSQLKLVAAAVFMVTGLSLFLSSQSALAQGTKLSGRVTDPQGNALPNASIQLVRHNSNKDDVLQETTSGLDGGFDLKEIYLGNFDIRVYAEGFRSEQMPVTVHAKINPPVEIHLTHLSSRVDTVTVTADLNDTDVFSPDPAEKVFVRQDILDANPGRPGAPVSVPGYPIETASSGIKAPQYFAPGVAGDHGEPIAQYIAVGSYLVPNNLSANAHGNGYADPNIFIPETIESVQVDGGAFNVREGNHAVNLAATYGLRSRLDPFFTITGDYRDIDAAAGFSPSPDSWMAFDASYGNGFLDRLEHRQQYKFNGERLFHMGEHRLALFGMGYYGFSYLPGLVPIGIGESSAKNVPNYGDTIDPRQKDQTHSALVALNDDWTLTSSQQVQLSGFFRTYNLSLYSDFGQGLIRQSEFRTVAGGSANYANKLSEYFSLLGGFDYQREAPRRDDLDHYGLFNDQAPAYYGLFTPISANNVTIASLAPYVAANGNLSRYIRYYLGWRRDQIDFTNNDLLHGQNSFQKWVGVNSPKATISFLPKESWYAPLISLSFGQAFFTNDPRIGVGNVTGTPISTAHSYQLVASKSFLKNELKLTLGHVTSSASLAKIDADTGLQENEGPGRLRFMSISVRHNFNQGSLLATFSKADARDLDTGEPTPEAPRTIFDLLGTIQKLPFRLQARGEFEYVGAKPLGTGCRPNVNAECNGVSVKEFRAALVRPFMEGRLNISVNLLLAAGYSGQTTENFYSSEISQVVGVRIPSYASLSFTYRFGGASSP
ncbi:MAG TPA: TonB-dependent receptor [Candidatus Sulfotelmatobacter sp.]